MLKFKVPKGIGNIKIQKADKFINIDKTCRSDVPTKRKTI